MALQFIGTWRLHTFDGKECITWSYNVVSAPPAFYSGQTTVVWIMPLCICVVPQKVGRSLWWLTALWPWSSHQCPSSSPQDALSHAQPSSGLSFFIPSSCLHPKTVSAPTFFFLEATENWKGGGGRHPGPPAGVPSSHFRSLSLLSSCRTVSSPSPSPPFTHWIRRLGVCFVLAIVLGKDIPQWARQTWCPSS